MTQELMMEQGKDGNWYIILSRPPGGFDICRRSEDGLRWDVIDQVLQHREPGVELFQPTP